ncbi:DUF6542 domain-containing protein [Mycobacterium numidiamassiliense]|uniref:DUF6542 domain-containing protein n=1 Tax=Mycobacterium numidiamassiliense TaxID=1841861 RepID=UPI00097D49BF|nr:DUF6542 domain-containing protein [Mycobacterium numidiamassiliense]
MSEVRESATVEPAQRSIYPSIAGVPWWIALLIAVTATAIGYGIDAGSGHKELTSVFAGFYIAGCVIAVLAVRQDGVFTTVIQPPLILFCAVPGAYWLFHGGKLGSLKDLLINCGYPLIERFPLMLGTAGGILLIGLVRWYFGMSHRTATARDTTDETADADGAKSFFLSSIGAKLNSLLGIDSDEDDTNEAAAAGSRRTTASRTSQRSATRTNRAAGRSGARPSRNGSRHARPPLDDEQDPAVEHRRRRRPAPPHDYDPDDPARRSRRRPRPPADSDPRGQAPRDNRREQRGYRDPYERSAPRGSRFDGYEPYESPGQARRFAPHEPYEYNPPSEPRRRRPAPNGTSGTNGANPTHHPISQVRYRGSGPEEPHQERRGRSRAPGRAQDPSRADSWEYDV